MAKALEPVTVACLGDDAGVQVKAAVPGVAALPRTNWRLMSHCLSEQT